MPARGAPPGARAPGAARGPGQGRHLDERRKSMGLVHDVRHVQPDPAPGRGRRVVVPEDGIPAWMCGASPSPPRGALPDDPRSLALRNISPVRRQPAARMHGEPSPRDRSPRRLPASPHALPHASSVLPRNGSGTPAELLIKAPVSHPGLDPVHLSATTSSHTSVPRDALWTVETVARPPAPPPTDVFARNTVESPGESFWNQHASAAASASAALSVLGGGLAPPPTTPAAPARDMRVEDARSFSRQASTTGGDEAGGAGGQDPLSFNSFWGRGDQTTPVVPGHSLPVKPRRAVTAGQSGFDVTYEFARNPKPSDDAPSPGAGKAQPAAGSTTACQAQNLRSVAAFGGIPRMAALGSGAAKQPAQEPSVGSASLSAGASSAACRASSSAVPQASDLRTQSGASVVSSVQYMQLPSGSEGGGGVPPRPDSASMQPTDASVTDASVASSAGIVAYDSLPDPLVAATAVTYLVHKDTPACGAKFMQRPSGLWITDVDTGGAFAEAGVPCGLVVAVDGRPVAPARYHWVLPVLLGNAQFSIAVRPEKAATAAEPAAPSSAATSSASTPRMQKVASDRLYRGLFSAALADPVALMVEPRPSDDGLGTVLAEHPQAGVWLARVAPGGALDRAGAVRGLVCAVDGKDAKNATFQWLVAQFAARRSAGVPFEMVLRPVVADLAGAVREKDGSAGNKSVSDLLDDIMTGGRPAPSTTPDPASPMSAAATVPPEEPGPPGVLLTSHDRAAVVPGRGALSYQIRRLGEEPVGFRAATADAPHSGVWVDGLAQGGMFERAGVPPGLLVSVEGEAMATAGSLEGRLAEMAACGVGTFTVAVVPALGGVDPAASPPRAASPGPSPTPPAEAKTHPFLLPLCRYPKRHRIRKRSPEERLGGVLSEHPDAGVWLVDVCEPDGALARAEVPRGLVTALNDRPVGAGDHEWLTAQLAAFGQLGVTDFSLTVQAVVEDLPEAERLYEEVFHWALSETPVTYRVKKGVSEEFLAAVAGHPSKGAWLLDVLEGGVFHAHAIPRGMITAINSRHVDNTGHDWVVPALSALQEDGAVQFTITIRPLLTDLPDADRNLQQVFRWPLASTERIYTVRKDSPGQELHAALCEHAAKGAWLLSIAPGGAMHDAGVPRGQLTAVNGEPTAGVSFSELVEKFAKLQWDQQFTVTVKAVLQDLPPEERGREADALLAESQGNYEDVLDASVASLPVTCTVKRARAEDEFLAVVSQQGDRVWLLHTLPGGAFEECGVPRGIITAVEGREVTPGDAAWVIPRFAALQEAPPGEFSVAVRPLRKDAAHLPQTRRDEAEEMAATQPLVPPSLVSLSSPPVAGGAADPPPPDAAPPLPGRVPSMTKLASELSSKPSDGSAFGVPVELVNVPSAAGLSSKASSVAGPGMTKQLSATGLSSKPSAGTELTLSKPPSAMGLSKAPSAGTELTLGKPPSAMGLSKAPSAGTELTLGKPPSAMGLSKAPSAGTELTLSKAPSAAGLSSKPSAVDSIGKPPSVTDLCTTVPSVPDLTEKMSSAAGPGMTKQLSATGLSSKPSAGTELTLGKPPSSPGLSSKAPSIQVSRTIQSAVSLPTGSGVLPAPTPATGSPMRRATADMERVFDMPLADAAHAFVVHKGAGDPGLLAAFAAKPDVGVYILAVSPGGMCDRYSVPRGRVVALNGRALNPTCHDDAERAMDELAALRNQASFTVALSMQPVLEDAEGASRAAAPARDAEGGDGGNAAFVEVVGAEGLPVEDPGARVYAVVEFDDAAPQETAAVPVIDGGAMWAYTFEYPGCAPLGEVRCWARVHLEGEVGAVASAREDVAHAKWKRTGDDEMEVMLSLEDPHGVAAGALRLVLRGADAPASPGSTLLDSPPPGFGRAGGGGAGEGGSEGGDPASAGGTESSAASNAGGATGQSSGELLNGVNGADIITIPLAYTLSKLTPSEPLRGILMETAEMGMWIADVLPGGVFHRQRVPRGLLTSVNGREVGVGDQAWVLDQLEALEAGRADTLVLHVRGMRKDVVPEREQFSGLAARLRQPSLQLEVPAERVPSRRSFDEAATLDGTPERTPHLRVPQTRHRSSTVNTGISTMDEFEGTTHDQMLQVIGLSTAENAVQYTLQRQERLELLGVTIADDPTAGVWVVDVTPGGIFDRLRIPRGRLHTVNGGIVGPGDREKVMSWLFDFHDQGGDLSHTLDIEIFGAQDDLDALNAKEAEDEKKAYVMSSTLCGFSRTFAVDRHAGNADKILGAVLETDPGTGIWVIDVKEGGLMHELGVPRGLIRAVNGNAVTPGECLEELRSLLAANKDGAGFSIAIDPIAHDLPKFPVVARAETYCIEREMVEVEGAMRLRNIGITVVENEIRGSWIAQISKGGEFERAGIPRGRLTELNGRPVRVGDHEWVRWELQRVQDEQVRSLTLCVQRIRGDGDSAAGTLGDEGFDAVGVYTVQQDVFHHALAAVPVSYNLRAEDPSDDFAALLHHPHTKDLWIIDAANSAMCAAADVPRGVLLSVNGRATPPNASPAQTTAWVRSEIAASKSRDSQFLEITVLPVLVDMRPRPQRGRGVSGTSNVTDIGPHESSSQIGQHPPIRLPLPPAPDAAGDASKYTITQSGSCTADAEAPEGTADPGPLLRPVVGDVLHDGVVSYVAPRGALTVMDHDGRPWVVGAFGSKVARGVVVAVDGAEVADAEGVYAAPLSAPEDMCVLTIHPIATDVPEMPAAAAVQRAAEGAIRDVELQPGMPGCVLAPAEHGEGAWPWVVEAWQGGSFADAGVKDVLLKAVGGVEVDGPVSAARRLAELCAAEEGITVTVLDPQGEEADAAPAAAEAEATTRSVPTVTTHLVLKDDPKEMLYGGFADVNCPPYVGVWLDNVCEGGALHNAGVPRGLVLSVDSRPVPSFAVLAGVLADLERAGRTQFTIEMQNAGDDVSPVPRIATDPEREVSPMSQDLCPVVDEVTTFSVELRPGKPCGVKVRGGPQGLWLCDTEEGGAFAGAGVPRGLIREVNGVAIAPDTADRLQFELSDLGYHGPGLVTVSMQQERTAEASGSAYLAADKSGQRRARQFSSLTDYADINHYKALLEQPCTDARQTYHVRKGAEGQRLGAVLGVDDAGLIWLTHVFPGEMCHAANVPRGRLVALDQTSVSTSDFEQVVAELEALQDGPVGESIELTVCPVGDDNAPAPARRQVSVRIISPAASARSSAARHSAGADASVLLDTGEAVPPDRFAASFANASSSEAVTYRVVPTGAGSGLGATLGLSYETGRLLFVDIVAGDFRDCGVPEGELVGFDGDEVGPEDFPELVKRMRAARFSGEPFEVTVRALLDAGGQGAGTGRRPRRDTAICVDTGKTVGPDRFAANLACAVSSQRVTHRVAPTGQPLGTTVGCSTTGRLLLMITSGGDFHDCGAPEGELVALDGTGVEAGDFSAVVAQLKAARNTRIPFDITVRPFAVPTERTARARRATVVVDTGTSVPEERFNAQFASVVSSQRLTRRVVPTGQPLGATIGTGDAGDIRLVHTAAAGDFRDCDVPEGRLAAVNGEEVWAQDFDAVFALMKAARDAMTPFEVTVCPTVHVLSSEPVTRRVVPSGAGRGYGANFEAVPETGQLLVHTILAGDFRDCGVPEGQLAVLDGKEVTAGDFDAVLAQLRAARAAGAPFEVTVYPNHAQRRQRSRSVAIDTGERHEGSFARAVARAASVTRRVVPSGADGGYGATLGKDRDTGQLLVLQIKPGDFRDHDVPEGELVAVDGQDVGPGDFSVVVERLRAARASQTPVELSVRPSVVVIEDEDENELPGDPPPSGGSPPTVPHEAVGGKDGHASAAFLPAADDAQPEEDPEEPSVEGEPMMEPLDPKAEAGAEGPYDGPKSGSDVPQVDVGGLERDALCQTPTALLPSTTCVVRKNPTDPDELFGMYLGYDEQTGIWVDVPPDGACARCGVPVGSGLLTAVDGVAVGASDIIASDFDDIMATFRAVQDGAREEVVVTVQQPVLPMEGSQREVFDLPLSDTSIRYAVNVAGSDGCGARLQEHEGTGVWVVAVGASGAFHRAGVPRGLITAVDDQSTDAMPAAQVVEELSALEALAGEFSLTVRPVVADLPDEAARPAGSAGGPYAAEEAEEEEEEEEEEHDDIFFLPLADTYVEALVMIDAAADSGLAARVSTHPAKGAYVVEVGEGGPLHRAGVPPGRIASLNGRSALEGDVAWVLEELVALQEADKSFAIVVQPAVLEDELDLPLADCAVTCSVRRAHPDQIFGAGVSELARPHRGLWVLRVDAGGSFEDAGVPRGLITSLNGNPRPTLDELSALKDADGPITLQVRPVLETHDGTHDGGVDTAGAGAGAAMEEVPEAADEVHDDDDPSHHRVFALPLADAPQTFAFEDPAHLQSEFAAMVVSHPTRGVRILEVGEGGAFSAVGVPCGQIVALDDRAVGDADCSWVLAELQELQMGGTKPFTLTVRPVVDDALPPPLAEGAPPERPPQASRSTVAVGSSEDDAHPVVRDSFVTVQHAAGSNDTSATPALQPRPSVMRSPHDPALTTSERLAAKQLSEIPRVDSLSPAATPTAELPPPAEPMAQRRVSVQEELPQTQRSAEARAVPADREAAANNEANSVPTWTEGVPEWQEKVPKWTTAVPTWLAQGGEPGQGDQPSPISDNSPVASDGTQGQSDASAQVDATDGDVEADGVPASAATCLLEVEVEEEAPTAAPSGSDVEAGPSGSQALGSRPPLTAAPSPRAASAPPAPMPAAGSVATQGSALSAAPEFSHIERVDSAEVSEDQAETEQRERERTGKQPSLHVVSATLEVKKQPEPVSGPEPEGEREELIATEASLAVSLDPEKHMDPSSSFCNIHRVTSESSGLPLSPSALRRARRSSLEEAGASGSMQDLARAASQSSQDASHRSVRVPSPHSSRRYSAGATPRSASSAEAAARAWERERTEMTQQVSTLHGEMSELKAQLHELRRSVAAPGAAGKGGSPRQASRADGTDNSSYEGIGMKRRSMKMSMQQGGAGLHLSMRSVRSQDDPFLLSCTTAPSNAPERQDTSAGYRTSQPGSTVVSPLSHASHPPELASSTRSSALSHSENDPRQLQTYHVTKAREDESLGAVLAVRPGSGLWVMTVRPGGPFARAEVPPGRVVAVNGEPCTAATESEFLADPAVRGVEFRVTVAQGALKDAPGGSGIHDYSVQTLPVSAARTGTPASSVSRALQVSQCSHTSSAVFPEPPPPLYPIHADPVVYYVKAGNHFMAAFNDDLKREVWVTNVAPGGAFHSAGVARGAIAAVNGREVTADDRAWVLSELARLENAAGAGEFALAVRPCTSDVPAAVDAPVVYRVVGDASEDVLRKDDVLGEDDAQVVWLMRVSDDGALRRAGVPPGELVALNGTPVTEGGYDTALADLLAFENAAVVDFTVTVKAGTPPDADEDAVEVPEAPPRRPEPLRSLRPEPSRGSERSRQKSIGGVAMLEPERSQSDLAQGVRVDALRQERCGDLPEMYFVDKIAPGDELGVVLARVNHSAHDASPTAPGDLWIADVADGDKFSRAGVPRGILTAVNGGEVCGADLEEVQGQFAALCARQEDFTVSVRPVQTAQDMRDEAIYQEKKREQLEREGSEEIERGDTSSPYDTIFNEALTESHSEGQVFRISGYTADEEFGVLLGTDPDTGLWLLDVYEGDVFERCKVPRGIVLAIDGTRLSGADSDFDLVCGMLSALRKALKSFDITIKALAADEATAPAVTDVGSPDSPLTSPASRRKRRARAITMARQGSRTLGLPRQRELAQTYDMPCAPDEQTYTVQTSPGNEELGLALGADPVSGLWILEVLPGGALSRAEVPRGVLTKLNGIPRTFDDFNRARSEFAILRHGHMPFTVSVRPLTGAPPESPAASGDPSNSDLSKSSMHLPVLLNKRQRQATGVDGGEQDSPRHFEAVFNSVVEGQAVTYHIELGPEDTELGVTLGSDTATGLWVLMVKAGTTFDKAGVPVGLLEAVNGVPVAVDDFTRAQRDFVKWLRAKTPFSVTVRGVEGDAGNHAQRQTSARRHVSMMETPDNEALDSQSAVVNAPLLEMQQTFHVPRRLPKLVYGMDMAWEPGKGVYIVKVGEGAVFAAAGVPRGLVKAVDGRQVTQDVKDFDWMRQRLLQFQRNGDDFLITVRPIREREEGAPSAAKQAAAAEPSSPASGSDVSTRSGTRQYDYVFKFPTADAPQTYTIPRVAAEEFGVTLGVHAESGLWLVDVFPGGAFHKAGVPRGPLLAVDGTSTAGLTFAEVKEQLYALQSSASGGDVSITVRPVRRDVQEAATFFQPVLKVAPGEADREEASGNDDDATPSVSSVVSATAWSPPSTPSGRRAIQIDTFRSHDRDRLQAVFGFNLSDTETEYTVKTSPDEQFGIILGASPTRKVWLVDIFPGDAFHKAGVPRGMLTRFNGTPTAVGGLSRVRSEVQAMQLAGVAELRVTLRPVVRDLVVTHNPQKVMIQDPKDPPHMATRPRRETMVDTFRSKDRNKYEEVFELPLSDAAVTYIVEKAYPHEEFGIILGKKPKSGVWLLDVFPGDAFSRAGVPRGLLLSVNDTPTAAEDFDEVRTALHALQKSAFKSVTVTMRPLLRDAEVLRTPIDQGDSPQQRHRGETRTRYDNCPPQDRALYDKVFDLAVVEEVQHYCIRTSPEEEFGVVFGADPNKCIWLVDVFPGDAFHKANVPRGVLTAFNGHPIAPDDDGAFDRIRSEMWALQRAGVAQLTVSVRPVEEDVSKAKPPGSPRARALSKVRVDMCPPAERDAYEQVFALPLAEAAETYHVKNTGRGGDFGVVFGTDAHNKVWLVEVTPDEAFDRAGVPRGLIVALNGRAVVAGDYERVRKEMWEAQEQRRAVPLSLSVRRVLV